MKFQEQLIKLSKFFPVAIRKKMPAEIHIVWVSIAASRRLNRLYRKKDKPTNVLSFRYGAEYGELLLCRPVVQREARAAGAAFHAQMTWMIVHGMLHLAGIHHEASAQAERRFEKIEEEVMRKMTNF
ncbi:MAG: rRNA maturation RNase YbeY [Candidatus Sungbacteria bacterium]|nr:rRNA maturation RNase YbeY [Candidatus Sungbacteria bacterium]